MPAPRVSEREFIELWREHGSASVLGKILNISPTKVLQRRRGIEKRNGITLPSKKAPSEKRYQYRNKAQENPSSINLGIENGIIIVFSDAHFWPGERTTAFCGLLELIKLLKPKAVVCNGDAFDGASISRHPAMNWDETPTVIQELNACTIALNEVEEIAKSANRNVRLIWPLGNHCQRFSARLAAVAHEYANVKGMNLSDHFPNWEHCLACWPNNGTVIKHRWHNGVHAVYNNALKSGKNIITGHLHQLKVTPWVDFNGVRYGVDTGTLSDPYHKKFDYAELNSVNWMSGLVVLTFKDGQLLMPELCRTFDDDHVEFRGELIKV